MEETRARPGATGWSDNPVSARFEIRNGPLDGASSNDVVSFGMTPKAGDARAEGSSLHGASSCTTRVPGDGAVIPLISGDEPSAKPANPATGSRRSATDDPESRRATRSRLNFTSDDVTGRPSA